MKTLEPTISETGHSIESEVPSRFYAAFYRRSQLFAVDVELVREVLPGQPLTRVPRAVEQIIGVLNLRGEILPVVVIDTHLGLPAVVDDPSLPILVLRRGDLLVGLRVDAVQGAISIPTGEILSHPASGDKGHLTGLWQPEGRPPVTLIAAMKLIETFYQQTSTN
ncbi:chemotaxis protein CheW [Pedosphaera parvula]|uniref:CheW protein n=1 Tax=Pedosphaera parvula (strain Ellin514) TaxID=320771 RepID=B9XDM1_PEDPL|nr:chemotaxis protein CheW [Pedosphaera parvula]EEF62167.1 CheW protein [Pedosphaera parvula Ellin514]